MSIFTYKNLYRAYLDCRKNKRKTANALKFEINLEDNLKNLLSELQNGNYYPGRSICFVVTEPVPREIFAADFRDRVAHHLFVCELIKQAERMFIYDSYACREGKGTHRAVKQLEKFIQQSRQTTVIARRSAATTKQSRVNRTVRLAKTDGALPPRLLRHSAHFVRSIPRSDMWFMKMDIKSFFMSIDQDILYSLALELIDRHEKPDKWKADMAELAEIIIFHKPNNNYLRKGDPKLADLIPAHKSLFGVKPEKGLPIGNYSSQFFANLYLNKLDHYIKRELKCKYYLRYVDDFILLSGDVQNLKNYRDAISSFLRTNLNLTINDEKTTIQPVERGIDFLGYFLKLKKIHARRKIYKRCKNKLFNAATGLKELPWNKSQAIAASYVGHSGYF